MKLEYLEENPLRHKENIKFNNCTQKSPNHKCSTAGVSASKCTVWGENKISNAATKAEYLVEKKPAG